MKEGWKDFSLPCKYKAIVMPTGPFCLIFDRKDAVKALQNFKDHLKAKGRIIIDLLLPYDFKIGDIVTESYLLPNGEGITLEKMERREINRYRITGIETPMVPIDIEIHRFYPYYLFFRLCL